MQQFTYRLILPAPHSHRLDSASVTVTLPTPLGLGHRISGSFFHHRDDYTVADIMHTMQATLVTLTLTK